jgi:hypothetical protein
MQELTRPPRIGPHKAAFMLAIQRGDRAGDVIDLAQTAEADLPDNVRQALAAVADAKGDHTAKPTGNGGTR